MHVLLIDPNKAGTFIETRANLVPMEMIGYHQQHGSWLVPIHLNPTSDLDRAYDFITTSLGNLLPKTVTERFGALTL